MIKPYWQNWFLFLPKGLVLYEWNFKFCRSPDHHNGGIRLSKRGCRTTRLKNRYCSLVNWTLVISLKFKFSFWTFFLIRKVVCGQPIRIFFCRFSSRTGIHIYLPPSYLSAQKCGYRFCLIAENRLLQTPVHMAFWLILKLLRFA